jgi:hypothetical protein
MNNISDKSSRANQNTNFTFNNLSSKMVARQTKDDNMAQAHCVLGIKGLQMHT